MLYHDEKINYTESLHFSDGKAEFAYSLINNNNYSKYNINDLFILECFNQTKKPKSIMEILNNTDKNYKNFSYYTITVKSKYPGNETHDNLIAHYLTENECRLQFYYYDIKLNLNDFFDPISFTLNSMFLQLNPILIQKSNIYYMNYHIDYDDKSSSKYFNDNYIEERTVFSRVENYAIYKGLNRSLNNFSDNDVYGKIYIRADNRRISIKIDFKDLLEIYNEHSIFWLTIYWIISFIFSIYDREKANHSISKKLFYFEGIENNRFKEFKKIKEIIDLNQVKERITHTRINNISTYIRNIPSSDILTVNSVKGNTNPIYNSNLEENNKDKNKKEKLINYSSFNLFDMIKSYKLFCCKTKEFESKVNLFKQAHKIIDDKLDIVLYIRNRILLEIINNIQLENKNIIDFLSRPIIYLNNEKERNKNSENEINDTATNASIEIDEEEIEQKKIDEKMNMPPIEVLKQFNSDNYKSAYHLNSDILSQKIEKLLKKEHKTRAEMKLLIYLKKQLKGVH